MSSLRKMSPSRTGVPSTVVKRATAKSGIGFFLLIALLVLPVTPVCASRPEKGAFLVASEKMTDPRFRGAVILILQHDPTGSVGLIVNKPLSITLNHAFRGLPADLDVHQPLFYGGPVNPNVTWVLFSGVSEQPFASVEIIPGVFVADAVRFTAAAKSAAGLKPIRFLSGYAGWAPGQLEMEMGRGDWVISPARAVDIFDGNPESLWEYLSGRGGVLI